MQKAVPVGEGAMAALLGLDLEGAREVAVAAAEGPAGTEVCDIANDNAPGQVLVSGPRTPVQRAVAIAAAQIRSASGRGRVGPYVSITVVAASLTKKNTTPTSPTPTAR